ncbi:MAG: adenosylhomocysteinase [Micrococcales bacterium]|nr:adenosylhomocysteinase [Micrococcales bacterium]
MTNTPKLARQPGRFAVRSLDLAPAGRHQICLAEQQMPGLMALRSELGPSKPLSGARITGSLHMTVQTAVLIETLIELGAQVRWASCNIFSTQDEAAAAVVVGPTGSTNSLAISTDSPTNSGNSPTISTDSPTNSGNSPVNSPDSPVKSGNSPVNSPDSPAGPPVFAWKGESLAEYWWATAQALNWGQAQPNLILDDGGDATLAVHVGRDFEADGQDAASYAALGESLEGREIQAMVRAEAARRSGYWTGLAGAIVGVSEETTTGVLRLYQLAEAGKLAFPAINVNDSVTKSKFDNIYGIRHSLPDGLNRATDMLIGGKTAVVCGYGDVGKGAAAALRGQGARVVVTEIDPICALQAAMDGYQVAQLDAVIAVADFVVTATGNRDVVTAAQMAAMKDKCVVGNVGHFDNEIDMAGLAGWPGVRRLPVKDQVDEWVFEDGHSILVLSEGRLLNLGNATGHPSFVMSCSFANQVLAQIELFRGGLELGVHRLPKELDEKVAGLHLAALGVDLTRLTAAQAAYIGVDLDGPYKPDHYRY